MIKVDFQKLKIPDDYKECVSKAEKRQNDLIQNSIDKREVLYRRTDTKCFHYIRPNLLKLFHNKCAYCETKILEAGTLDNFRPKSIYPILTYHISNLLPACPTCNMSKGGKFPIKGKVDSEQVHLDVDQEQYMLLNPYVDDPNEHLNFEANGIINPLTERGAITIEILNLNRPTLVAARHESIEKLKRNISTLEAIKKSPSTYELVKSLSIFISNEISDSSEFSAIKKQYYSSIYSNGKVPSSNKIENIEHIGSTFNNYWIEKLVIKNFKTIDHLEIDIAKDGLREPAIILLGENGVGKSSVLEALALALTTSETRNIFVEDASTLLNKLVDAEEGSILVKFFQREEALKLCFFKKRKNFVVENGNIKLPVLAYGATRLFTPLEDQLQEPNSINIDNLFNPWKTLINVNQWLTNTNLIDDDKFYKLAASLRLILDLNDNDEIHRDSSSVYIWLSSYKQKIYFDEYSTGYKNVISLVSDIIFNLTNSTYDIEHAEGLVLIDEIENHLHPKWKSEIIIKLRTVFPRISFIFTTHDPLCIQNSYNGEIYYLSLDKESHEFSYSQLDVPKGLNADQLLTGTWFGLNSTVDKDTLELLNEYSELLLSRKTKKNIQRINFIEEELRDRFGSFAETSMEKFAIQEARKILNKQVQEITKEDIIRTKSMLQELLTNEEV